jgi:hypothetical protein
MVQIVDQGARLQQLAALEVAIDALVEGLKRTGCYVEAIPELEECRQASVTLRQNGFEQRQLNELSRAVPRLFWLHKEWMPPLVEMAPDHREEPVWFKELAPLEQRLQELAYGLRVVGEY